MTGRHYQVWNSAGVCLEATISQCVLTDPEDANQIFRRNETGKHNKHFGTNLRAVGTFCKKLLYKSNLLQQPSTPRTVAQKLIWEEINILILLH